MRRVSLLWLCAVSLIAPAISEAQLFRFRVTQSQACYGADCIPQVGAVASQPALVPLSTPEGIEEVSSAVADGPHTRALVSGSCGSGTICGADASGGYVVSNAHVWGTQIGKRVTIDIVSGGQTRRLSGNIVFAGYSNSRMVDFAIAKFEGLTSQRYMPMFKSEPANPPYGTTGSPRCVWPLVTKQFNDPRNYGQGLITGLPDAIGGQSGSAIYNSTGQQIALLTWSINGRCAGQKTSKLWEVASQRNVLLADPRPEGLVELCGNPQERPETEEGIFGELPSILAEEPRQHPDGAFHEESGEESSGALDLVGPRVRPVTENVIASQLNATMNDMPIWYNPSPKPPVEEPKPDPKPEPDGDCDCYRLNAKEWALIQFLRAQQSEKGRFGDFLSRVDWAELMKQIMELIKLINSLSKADAVPAHVPGLAGVGCNVVAPRVLQA